ncbi:MAG: hypothetical protein JWL77_1441 [Chthonomonadaceae bacterium]|nr:hypothetical protein [Chthonomonadaceae bacterium]
MAIVHYTARAKDSRTLELPEEAQALGLQTGDEVHVFVNRNEDLVTEASSDEAQQERFRAVTAQLFAEADATERQPGIYTDPQKASVATTIAEKHRKMGLRV